MLIAITMGTSMRTIRCLICKGVISPLIPKISKIFAILDPMMLPKTKSAESFIAAFKLMASSGAPVANATTVSPMTMGETPHFRPNRSTAFKNNSAPKMRPASPKTKSKRVISNLIKRLTQDKYTSFPTLVT